jgi:hypothetical protein
VEECIPLEVLGTLDAEDPRRLHIERCARCSAMLAAYREFVRADAPGRARMRDADARLAAFVAERVERGDAKYTEPVAGAPRPPRGRWLRIPAVRFVATTAVFLLIAVAVTQFLPDSKEALVLRGDPRAAFSLEVPRAQDDGTLELSWASVADADAYQVTILGDDLSEVFRLPATHDTRVSLDVGVLPAQATRWQVTALREGGVIAESSPAILRP